MEPLIVPNLSQNAKLHKLKNIAKTLAVYASKDKNSFLVYNKCANIQYLINKILLAFNSFTNFLGSFKSHTLLLL